eukprot:3421271-Amphidinium_carterae.1
MLCCLRPRFMNFSGNTPSEAQRTFRYFWINKAMAIGFWLTTAPQVDNMQQQLQQHTVKESPGSSQDKVQLVMGTCLSCINKHLIHIQKGKPVFWVGRGNHWACAP